MTPLDALARRLTIGICVNLTGQVRYKVAGFGATVQLGL